MKFHSLKSKQNLKNERDAAKEGFEYLRDYFDERKHRRLAKENGLAVVRVTVEKPKVKKP